MQKHGCWSIWNGLIWIYLVIHTKRICALFHYLSDLKSSSIFSCVIEIIIYWCKIRYISNINTIDILSLHSRASSIFSPVSTFRDLSHIYFSLMGLQTFDSDYKEENDEHIYSCINKVENSSCNQFKSIIFLFDSDMGILYMIVRFYLSFVLAYVQNPHCIHNYQAGRKYYADKVQNLN